MRDNEFTKILGWPGYRVYQQEIDEAAKALRLWVRRQPGNRKLICSGCGRKFSGAHDGREREVRDLPWGEYRTTVIIELYRVCCPQCGVRVEKVPQLPSKAPFSKRFEEAVGLACESASVRQVARRFRLAASTVRSIPDEIKAFIPADCRIVSIILHTSGSSSTMRAGCGARCGTHSPPPLLNSHAHQSDP